ncbi:AAA family ATPase [Novosphingobium album (ex Hu et al. 2023)]|uniref:AAA family ATPase n=1 Tax=Novosphingobium album (ex Hu et al. 2023) TaxID=2930093 RepID=A0ABT0B745_9SPHN|nr:AAA family ATPase [Novosphingobium album (ex Hu et al. 2023)]MCJ2180818.1 AAA family ATPase [Novosphingobium album (ex Hu et al. 2023)]
MTLTLTDLKQITDELGGLKPNKDSQFRPMPAFDHDLEIMRSALASIPPDVPRGDGTIFSPDGGPVDDYWFGVVLAARREGGEAAKELVREWSRSSDRYSDDGFEQAWAEFEPEHPKPVTMKSVYRLALSFGWKRPARASRFELLDRTSIMALKPIEWRVKGLFPKEGIGAIFGPSGSGKSFLAIDLAIRLASGSNWFGHKTVPSAVTYVMLEGEAGLRNRIVAWEQANAGEVPLNFSAVTQSFDIAVPEDVEDLAAAVPHGGVIIIDTLNRAAPGKDENSSKDMGETIAGLKNLQKLTNGLVLVVHHTGKDTSRGMRGHSSLPAALDGAIEVKRNGQQRSWSVAKAKDGADGMEVPFKLEFVHLAFDADGEAITSCVAVHDAFPLVSTKEPQGRLQRDALNAIRSNPGTCISWDEAVSAVAASLSVPSNKRSYEARRVLTDLIKHGFLTQDPTTNEISA